MAISCAECGVRAGTETLFHPYHPGVAAAPLHFCPACWGGREAATHRKGVVLVLAVLLLALPLAGLLPGDDGRVVSLALWVVVLEVLSTVLHELGHAGAAWAQGLLVHRISFGAGPVLVRWRGLGTEWELRSVPVCGFVQASTRLDALARVRGALVSLAGPATNALLFALAWYMSDGLWPGEGWELELREVTPWHMLAGVNAVILAVNLIPFGFPREGGAGWQPNDGLLTLIELFAPQWLFARWAAASSLQEVRALLAAGARDEAERVVHERLATASAPDLQVAHAEALRLLGRPGAAAERLKAMLDADDPDQRLRAYRAAVGRPELAPTFGPYLEPELAYRATCALAEAALEAGQLALAAEAAAAAMDRGPSPFARRAQARVLLAQGAYAQAAPALEALLAIESPPDLRAQLARDLAAAARGLGDVQQAERWEALAARLQEQGDTW